MKKQKKDKGMEYLETVLVQPILFEATTDEGLIYRGGMAYMINDGQNLDVEELRPMDFRTYAIPVDMISDDKDQMIIDMVEIATYMYDNVYPELLMVKEDGTLELIDISELFDDDDEEEDEIEESVKITHDVPHTIH